MSKTIAHTPCIQELQTTFGDQLSLNPTVLETHGQDESSHECMPPDAVLFAQSTDDVSRAVKLCAAHKIPIIPYGTGTSLEGHINAVNGGLCIDLSRMNSIVQVNTADMDVRVQAGITRGDLNSFLRDQGLFFPVDPGANCSLGGMVATRASGTNAVKYGTMREQLLSLQVVTASGDVIETGTRSKKSAAGYDLTHLFCGSEGTLGIVTEISVRVHGIPDKIAAGVCRFNSLEDAVNTVMTTMQMDIPISRIELLDDFSIKAVNTYSHTSYPETATLFLEFSGTDVTVADQISSFTELAEDYGGNAIEFAEQQEDINSLWHARHQMYYASKALGPNKHAVTTDVCVPISRLADCMLTTRQKLDESGLLCTMLGHVGDGNFHTIILADENNPTEMQMAEELNKNMVKLAISMGGTCTGEHGIGLGKRDFLMLERGTAIPIMKQVKKALDPHGIMNPGKIFPN